MSERGKLDEKAAEIQKAIAEIEKEMKDAADKRAETQEVYDTNSADMKGALEALDAAIKALKASRPASLASMRSVVKTVRKATLMADALGLGGPKTQKAVAALLQQPEVPM